MAVNNPADRIARRQRVLHDLLRERGVQRYGLFMVTTEGKTLPDGSESASGYAVDEHGRVFFFWLDWDGSEQRPTFIRWRQVEPRPEWEDDEEYQEARSQAGLDAA